MRKRNIQKIVRLSRDEAQDLQKKAKKACLSEAGLIRLLLRGYEPREKPDERFYDVMRELSAIGNNINQLKYWTIVPKGYKKPIRLKNLGEDYTEEAIKRRLTENQGVRLMPFTNQTVVIRQYRLPTREHKIKKVGGLYGLYLHYCYKLGYLPKYKKQNTARLHYLLKEDLLKLDKITQETRLLGRENISTDEQLFSYKESVLSQIENLTDDRTHLRKQLRKNMSDDELSKVKEQIKTITDKLWTLRKEVGLCDDIAKRSKVIEANIETVRAYEEKQERKEQNRNDKFR